MEVLHVLPIKCLYLSSSGLTANAVSPSIVSGLVVAISKNPHHLLMDI